MFLFCLISMILFTDSCTLHQAEAGCKWFSKARTSTQKKPDVSRISSLTSGFSVQQLPVFAFRLSSALSSLTAVFGMLQIYPARYRHCTSID